MQDSFYIVEKKKGKKEQVKSDKWRGKIALGLQNSIKHFKEQAL